MTQRDDIIEWANGLRGQVLACNNGLLLTVTDAYWVTSAPFWLALRADAGLAALGPNAVWLASDADVGWAGLLSQISLPTGLLVAGSDRMIVTPTSIRAVLRLSIA
jgi:hypothetical protein